MADIRFCEQCGSQLTNVANHYCTLCGAKVGSPNDRPAQMDVRAPFIDNPYRVLRLSAKAGPADIQSRYAEARVAARLDDDGGTDQSDRLLRAHSQLLDPASRWSFEVCWFYDPPEALFDGEITNENDVQLDFQRQSSLPGIDGTLGKHDLANWLFLQAVHSIDQKWELSVRALSLWADLIDNQEYLRMLNATYENQSLTRERLWDQVVIQQFSTAAREHAINGEAGHVVSYIEAFKSAGRGNDELVDFASASLEAQCDGVQRAIDTIPDEDSEAMTPARCENLASVIALQAGPLKASISAINRPESEATAVIAACNAVLDAAAMRIRSAVIECFNNNERYSGRAIGVLTRAHDIAVTKLTAGRLSDDIKSAIFHSALDEMSTHITGNRFDRALEAANRAVASATDAEQRAQAAGFINQITAARSRSSGPNEFVQLLGGIGRYALGLALIVGVGYGCRALVNSGNNTSYSPPARSAPAIQPPSNSSGSGSLATLKSQIENNNRTLDQLVREWDSIAAQHKQICPVDNCRLSESAYQRAESLERRGNEIKAEHERLRAQTQRLIDRYNRSR